MDTKVEAKDKLQQVITNQWMSDKDKKQFISPVFRQIASAVAVGSIGCVFGIVIAFSSVALGNWKIERDVSLNEDQINWFAIVIQLVSIPGSVVGGGLVQHLGARRLLILILPPLALTWPILLLSRSSPAAMIILRAIQGLLTAGGSICVYVYPCEVSEPKRRGLLGAVPEAAFSLGFFLTYIFGGVFHWTTVVLIIPCISVPCMIFLLLVPESPTKLIKQGKIEEAKRTLESLRPHGYNVEMEVREMQNIYSLTNSCEETHCQSVQGLSKPNALLPVAVSTTLLVLKECTGQLVLALFVVQIFQNANAEISPLHGSVIVGSVRFLSNVIGAFLLGCLPRKKIIIIASLVAGLSVALLGSHFYEHENENKVTWAPLLYFAVFTLAFGIGIGPTSYLMATELLPSSVRGTGSGIAGAAAFAAQFFITLFAAKTSISNLFISFWAYGVGCLTLATFVLLLPETQELTLQEVEAYWSKAANNLYFTKSNNSIKEQNNNDETADSNVKDDSKFSHLPRSQDDRVYGKVITMVDLGKKKEIVDIV
ncbi:facilitated trehalose transporter Tret1-2 homolog [Palaemon carinicauda]|uniref:facilitated trehalose transporter Tret1-2 homolog n=1 Tax=Palaemon carinicauda TaxID=392227 RepID=UPI0035B587D5